MVEWRVHGHEEFRVVAVDLTAFWRPILKTCPSQHFHPEAGRALPDMHYLSSFWATLKTELIYRHLYRTRAEAQNAIFAYIEDWYNRQRRHSTLGYLSSEQFEHQFLS